MMTDTTDADLPHHRIAAFEARIRDAPGARVDATRLWQALAEAFPFREAGPTERRLLVSILRRLDADGVLRLPPARGTRWDRSLDPPVPTSVDLLNERDEPADSWRELPWHPRLEWVLDLRRLDRTRVMFLRRVHDAWVAGALNEPAPIRHRSLQLTGDEKALTRLSKTSLFGPGRLSLDELGCLPDLHPLVWERVGAGDTMLVLENAGPFGVARGVLTAATRHRYGSVAYGAGKAFLSSVAYVATISPRPGRMEYVGDIDDEGVAIAIAARAHCRRLGLPELGAASGWHRAMLDSAVEFGFRDGWPSRAARGASRSTRGRRRSDTVAIAADFFGESADRVVRILAEGRRVPEEVLSPEDMRRLIGDDVRRASSSPGSQGRHG